MQNRTIRNAKEEANLLWQLLAGGHRTAGRLVGRFVSIRTLLVFGVRRGDTQ
jgi:hypothetical protein